MTTVDSEERKVSRPQSLHVHQSAFTRTKFSSTLRIFDFQRRKCHHSCIPVSTDCRVVGLRNNFKE